MENKAGKRILMLTPFASPNLGGAETHLDDLCAYLTNRGYQITLLTYQPLTTKAVGTPYEERNNLKIHRFYLYGNNLFHKLENFHPVFNFSYLTPVLLFKSFMFMFRHHREIEIIHVFGLSAAFIARILKIFFNKPIVMSTEAIYNFNTRSLFAVVSRWVLGGFDRILAQSLDSKVDIMKLGIPESHIVVYSHWINLRAFKPGDKPSLKLKLGWGNKFTALYVGRLIPQKGISVFLEVARQCLEGINFKVIGDDGPELAAVKEAAAHCPNLEFLGKIAYERLPEYYAAADVFVYPALYQEDMARVIIESLACGTPVILSNKGSGVYEINDNVGFVVEPRVEEIMRCLAGDRKRFNAMSAACAGFADKFGGNQGKIITDSYDFLVASKRV